MGRNDKSNFKLSEFWSFQLSNWWEDPKGPTYWSRNRRFRAYLLIVYILYSSGPSVPRSEWETNESKLQTFKLLVWFIDLSHRSEGPKVPSHRGSEGAEQYYWHFASYKEYSSSKMTHYRVILVLFSTARGYMYCPKGQLWPTIDGIFTYLDRHTVHI